MQFRTQGIFFRALTGGFLILTTLVFLGPALVLGLPVNLSGGAQSVFDGLTAGLVVLQVTILLAITPTLARTLGTRSLRSSLLIAGAIQALALGNAAFLALGLRWSGLGLELAQVLWFVAPLALWAFFAWPRSRPTPTEQRTRP
ncbi:MAG: hypothetical protein ACE5M4_13525, partial [Anaerolineales bacterium]